MSKTGSVNSGPARPPQPSRKELLAERLVHWPLLQLMVTSVAFRAVILLFILAVLAGAALLLKVWRVSPPGETPVVRISLLDRIQAWSLARNATKAEARGDYENALSAWRAAAANNPGDPQALRKCLEVIPHLPQPEDSARLAINVANRLMRLSGTNAADLPLIASVWNDCGLHSGAARLLGGTNYTRTVDLDRLRATVLFRAGQATAFETLVAGNPILVEELRNSVNPPSSTDGTGRSTEWRAVCLAYIAGWGGELKIPREISLQAEKELAALAESPAARAMATDLQMRVYRKQGNLDGCKQTLEELENAGHATMAHRVMYWELAALQEPNGLDQARELVRAANPVPKNEVEAIKLVKLYTSLGLLDEADKLCQNHLGASPWLDEGVMLRSNILIELRKWADLRQLAMSIRKYPILMDSLGGLSYFLEGLAEFNEGYTGNAESCFAEAGRVGVPEIGLAIDVANRMVESPRDKDGTAKYKIGDGKFAKQAALILDKLPRAQATNNTAYLTARFKVAYRMKDATNLLNSISRLHELAPKDLMVLQNYVGAQLLLRTNAAETLSHSLELMQSQTKSAVTRLSIVLNRALALVQNDRLADAEKLFDQLRILMAGTGADAPDPETRAEYHLGLFELWYRQGRKAEALAEKALIDTSLLFPEQIRWLESATQDLETAAPPAADKGAAPATRPGS